MTAGKKKVFLAMPVSVFVGISVDGFMARRDGVLDFLPEDGGEPHGYTEFYAGIDALVIGRNTFPTVRFRYVAIRRQAGFRAQQRYARSVHSTKLRGGAFAGAPGDIVATLAARGPHEIYVDGGVTIQRFLRARLIDRPVITRVPVLIGQGVPLFGPLERDVLLHHIVTFHFESGLVQSEYQVRK
jgi:dihydrofolate reductase